MTDIELIVQKIQKLQNDIKAIKASIKDLTPEPEDLKALKKKRKELSEQIKDMQDDIEREMNEDMDIVDFKKQKIEAEEELAELKNTLYDEINKINKNLSLSVNCEEGLVKLQSVKSFRVFFNGKELPIKIRL